MNKIILTAIGMLILMAFCGCGGPKMHIAGDWTSSEGGAMTIRQDSDHISGTYTLKGGTITGKLSGNVLNGYWIQNSSGKRCATSRGDSYYWGILQLVFTDQSYSGNWGWCEDKPANSWTGNRRH
jgi:hypothetical protein